MAKDNNVIVLTGVQDSIPLSSAGSGTIDSVNDNRKVIGSGSSFLSEVEVGQWIYIKTRNDFRKVTYIHSDTELTIDEPFEGGVLSGETYFITPHGYYSEVSMKVTGAAGALIDAAPLAAGDVINQSTAHRNGSYAGRQLDPVDVDATGTTVRVTVIV